MAQFARWRWSHQKDDLDKSILHNTEAILLPPIFWTSLNIVETLFQLALFLTERCEKFEQPDDIKYSIEYLRHLRRFPLDSFKVPRTIVTTSFIQALSIHVQLKSGNEPGTRDLKEIVVLCNELFSSNKPEDVPTATFWYLYRAVIHVELNRGFPTEMLDELIECLRDAVKVCSRVCTSGSHILPHIVIYSLAYSLGIRFIQTHSKEAYEEATELLERILEPGGCPDSFRVIPSSLAKSLAHGRSVFFQDPEYSEVALSRLRAESSFPPLDERLQKRLRLSFASNLVAQTSIRFREYSLDENLQERNTYISQLVNASSSSNLAESTEPPPWLGLDEVRATYSTTDIQQRIEHLEHSLSITPPGTERYTKSLGYLKDWYETKFRCTNDISDLEESIKYSRLSLDSTPVGALWRVNHLGSLRNILLLAFQKTGKIDYLDESITICYEMLELQTAKQVHFSVTQVVVWSLITRERLLGRIEDHHEAIRLISLGVMDDRFSLNPDRFRLSCQWAILARSVGHSTTLAAYKTAMSLMQKSFSFAPTVSVQHTRLVAMGENCQRMPLDYASYQIQLGQFEEAVETLEQGRALLWSEMRSLRTPAFQLIEEDSPLARRFAEINQELETLTISVTPSGKPEIDDGVQDGTDAFGRLALERKKLVEERDTLISQIQSRPGSEGFLGAPSFDTLRSAASHGPVIIINHCEWRSDIIIIFHNSLPCSIPTAETFYSDANKLQDELVKGRKAKSGLDSKEYREALCSALKGLYELVGQPVIKRFRLLGVPEQSRIWWCPTSVFCSLPLHAMGPIPSSEPGNPRYFSDLYIPSYTPTLSALIDSRKARAPGQPSLLLVAQPDHDLPGVKGEIKVIRKLGEKVLVTELISSDATPTSVIEGLRGSSLAHFACHGTLETGKPFEASFNLHEGERLTLLKIVQSRLPDAEFAFLSCCHAAEITAKSVSDEALHLTAAMQYCGFRSVVGTMWAMADTDGRDLANNFYKSLFSSEDSSVPYYERSAEALRDATQKLRRKRGIGLERWVNFVHYGA